MAATERFKRLDTAGTSVRRSEVDAIARDVATCRKSAPEVLPVIIQKHIPAYGQKIRTSPLIMASKHLA